LLITEVEAERGNVKKQIELTGYLKKYILN